MERPDLDGIEQRHFGGQHTNMAKQINFDLRRVITYARELEQGIQQNDSDSGELIETLRHLLQQWEQRVVCPQCGHRYSDRACGPTHAVVMNLVRPNNADSGRALMSDLSQSELKPDLRGQVIHNDSHEGNE